jgi:hypothetical protein
LNEFGDLENIKKDLNDLKEIIESEDLIKELSKERFGLQWLSIDYLL